MQSFPVKCGHKPQFVRILLSSDLILGLPIGGKLSLKSDDYKQKLPIPSSIEKPYAEPKWCLIRTGRL
jgi:hypothetical protein